MAGGWVKRQYIMCCVLVFKKTAFIGEVSKGNVGSPAFCELSADKIGNDKGGARSDKARYPYGSLARRGDGFGRWGNSIGGSGSWYFIERLSRYNRGI